MSAKTKLKVSNAVEVNDPGGIEDTGADKYLTDIKELPPSTPVEVRKVRKTEAQVGGYSEDALVKKPAPVKKSDNQDDVSDTKTNMLTVLEDSAAKERKFPFTYKEVILGIVNLASIVFIAILLANFPKKSNELRDLRIKEMRDKTTVSLEMSEIEAARPKAEVLKELFLDEGGVVNFVGDVEKHKTEGSAISKVTFASQNVEKDRTGNYGYPVIIELTGSWEAIDTDLQKIDSMLYLFRPVKVDISYDEENPEVVIFKYGIFLYVRESLGKTR